MSGSSNDLTRVVLIMNIVLVVAVCALVAKEFMQSPSNNAYAAGGASGGKYIAVPLQYGQYNEALVLIDTSSDAMVVYQLNQRGDNIYPPTARTIDQDFKILMKMKENYWTGVGANDKGFYPANMRDSLAKSEATKP